MCQASRSRFVILKNLGHVYLALAEVDAWVYFLTRLEAKHRLARTERRRDAGQAWVDVRLAVVHVDGRQALDIDEGATDRAVVALECVTALLENESKHSV